MYIYGTIQINPYKRVKYSLSNYFNLIIIKNKESIKESTNNRKNLINKMKYFSEDSKLDLTLENFLKFHKLSLYDFYGKNGDRTFNRMLVEAGLKKNFYCENEEVITRRLNNLFHINSVRLLKFLIKYIEDRKVNNEEEMMMLSMLYYSFYTNHPAKEGVLSIEDGINKILKNLEMKEEISSIIKYNYNHIHTMEIDNDFDFSCPLGVHSSYTTSQVLASLGYFNEEKSPSFREGVKHFKDKKLDIFFITLNKSEKDFSPSTLYEDYAIDEKLFHWQTQSKVKEDSNTAQRYINHKKTGNKIALFVREYKKENGYTSPFIFLGSAVYISHSGNKPMSFIWELEEEMPPMFVPKANKNIL